MKHGKRITLRQRKLIKAAGLNPDNWLVTKRLSNELHIVHKLNGKERVVKINAGR